MNTLLRTAAIFGVLAVGSSFGWPIARHQAGNQARINQGVRSGELTRGEAARLQARDNAIQRTIRRDRIDGGGLSLAERRKIDRRQDALSRDIARQKHDGQYR
ncbi:MAG: hypothetical protein ABI972_21610 [Acidobacteriota bacterium]